MTALSRLGLIALAMTAFLGFMVIDHANARASGTEIVLDVRGYDPRDIFLGHFSLIRTDLQQLDASELDGDDSFERGDPIYVVLERGDDDSWAPVSLHATRPDSGVFIHGFVGSRYTIEQEWTDPETGEPLAEARRVNRIQIHASFNIERYYASREMALDFDRRLRSFDEDGNNGVRLILSLPPSGDAIIKGFEIDGVRRIDRLW
ncbi:GDYXXLXY domain-containing protein [Maricaulis sp.]|uniref:GDYXXLXY domain-containing protein n=1 Tax=Maricaulis sp. TaxID=1486257 RepID=UPI003A943025